MTCSPKTFRSSFINQIVKRETRIYLLKGNQHDFDCIKKQGYKDLSGGKLYTEYFYVLCDSKWILSKEVGDDFLSKQRIDISKAISYDTFISNSSLT